MLSDFVDMLDKKGILVRIKKPVSLKYEMAAIMREMPDRPMLFENVKESRYKVIANLCPTREIVAMGLGTEKHKLIEKMSAALKSPKEPKPVRHSYRELPLDLTQLPILTYYKEDGGPYIASGIMFIHDKEYGINASYHRMMVMGKDMVAARILPRHFNEFIKRGNKEFAICIGNSMQVLLASAMSPDIGVSELSIANAMKDTKVVEVDGHVVPEAEIVMIAECTGERAKEGPFLDLTETFDIVREEPVFRIKKIYAKENPLFHALMPGGLEHKVLMGMPKEPTIFNEVSKVCECRNVYITPGGCSWLHGVVQIKKNNHDDGIKALEAAFRGHKSMKQVIIVDDDINIFDPHEVEWAIATRFQGDKNLVVKTKQKGSSLDPSADPVTRETAKVGIDATIPGDKKREDFIKPGPPLRINLKDYVV